MFLKAKLEAFHLNPVSLYPVGAIMSQIRNLKILVFAGHCYAWQYESSFFLFEKATQLISCPFLKSPHPPYCQNAYSISYNMNRLYQIVRRVDPPPQVVIRYM